MSSLVQPLSMVSVVSFVHFCVPVTGIKDSLGREGEVVLTDMFGFSGFCSLGGSPHWPHLLQMVETFPMPLL